jgi:predicted dehydrogenase
LIVVVEKPFTCTSAEADEVIQAATRKGVILTVYQSESDWRHCGGIELGALASRLNHPDRRYDSDFLALQDVIDRGYLGTISEAEFHHDLPFPAMLTKMTSSDRRPGMGMAYTAGSHSIDQALSLFGRPRGVTAFYRSLRGIQSDEEDSFTITLSYDSPLLVHIKTNAQTMMNRPLTYFVRGSTGAFVKFGGDVQIKQIREKGMSPGDEGFGEEPEDMWGELTTVNRVREGQVGRGGFWVGKVPSGKEGYQKYYRDLVETLQGRKKLAIDPVLSRNGIRVIELATQSAKEGRTLRFA